MDDRFKEFPRYLAERARRLTLGNTPAMVALPDLAPGQSVPAVLWLHGRTANKEMDPGRYMRWLRAGIAAVAIDLPGHGERLDAAMQEPARTLDVLEQALSEIDAIVRDIRALPGIDASKLGLGGMSLGGMVTLRRLCDPHPFRAAAVEGTSGWLEGMYFPTDFGLPVRPWPVDHPRPRVQKLEALRNLGGMAPLPLLLLHSEADEMVPWEVQKRFIETLRTHYTSRVADPALIQVQTWPTTGAPREHIGFGRVSNDAKNLQTDFFAKSLGL